MVQINSPRIDIIIPAYKAHNTIFNTLASIAYQTVINDIDITVVNDCCPEGSYNDIINKFKEHMSIREIQTNENCGPGMARQFGIDNTNNKYIIFIDADDVFLDCMVIKTMVDEIEKKQLPILVTGFIEQTKNNELVRREPSLAWLHGKVYNRQFLTEYDIRFNSMRYCEDYGFNSKIYSLLKNPEDCELPIYTYFWLNSSNSIVRENNGQYTYDMGVRGLVDNTIDTLFFMKNKKLDFERCQIHIAQALIELYYEYNEILEENPLYAEQTWYYIRKLYHYSKDYIDMMSYNILLNAINIYLNTYFSTYSELKAINSISLQDFLLELKKQPFKDTEITEIRKKLPDITNYDENIYRWND